MSVISVQTKKFGDLDTIPVSYTHLRCNSDGVLVP